MKNLSKLFFVTFISLLLFSTSTLSAADYTKSGSGEWADVFATHHQKSVKLSGGKYYAHGSYTGEWPSTCVYDMKTTSNKQCSGASNINTAYASTPNTVGNSWTVKWTAESR